MKLSLFSKLPEDYRKQLLSLLEEVDREFVPPLSTRSSSTDQSFHTNETSNGVEKYLESLQEQFFILAVEDGTLAGMLSFRADYFPGGANPSFPLPNYYVTTIAVSEMFRGCGVARGLYEKLFSLTNSPKTIVVRTWSTNNAHLSLLENLGFKQFSMIEDDRSPGIDTVIYEKRI